MISANLGTLARLSERGSLYSLMNISFHRSRTRCVYRVAPSGMHLCRQERSRAHIFLSGRKKPSEGANRVTELRDRIKTASVCPPTSPLPPPLLCGACRVATQKEDYIEIPDVNFLIIKNDHLYLRFFISSSLLVVFFSLSSQFSHSS